MLKLTIPVRDVDTLRVVADLLEESGLVPEIATDDEPAAHPGFTRPPIPVTTMPHVPAAQPETPTPTPAAPVAQPASEEVDAEGIRWNADIHASTKGKTSKGVWKKKRGVSKELYDSVIAGQLGAAARAEPAQPVAAAQPAATIPVPAAQPETPGVPPIPGVTVPVPGAEASQEAPRFTDIGQAITHLSQVISGKLTDGAAILAEYQKCGFDPQADAQNLEKITQAVTHFEAL